MKGDMGRKPKALAALVRNSVNMFGDYNVGLVCTNHTYASQDMFDPMIKFQVVKVSFMHQVLLLQ